MEERLAQRIGLFRESGQARPEVADFVTAELTALAEEGTPVSETTAGMLASHLMMALGRLLNGEVIPLSPADDRIAAELADHPDAVARARGLAARAAARLGAELPESEIHFLAAHLVVLAGRTRTA